MTPGPMERIWTRWVGRTLSGAAWRSSARRGGCRRTPSQAPLGEAVPPFLGREEEEAGAAPALVCRCGPERQRDVHLGDADLGWLLDDDEGMAVRVDRFKGWGMTIGAPLNRR